jgi:hypothetical protein
MIVPMKKATILTEAKDAGATVKYLRTLGVLHVEHQNLPEGRNISALQENVALINSSFDVVNEATGSGINLQPQKKISGDWTAVANHIIELNKRKEQLESSSRTITSQINEWERWGDVDLHQIQHLSKNGVYLKLYKVPVKEMQSFPKDIAVKTIFTAGDIAYCAVISQQLFECAFDEVLPPNQSVSLQKSVSPTIIRSQKWLKVRLLNPLVFMTIFLMLRKNWKKRSRSSR